MKSLKAKLVFMLLAVVFSILMIMLGANKFLLEPYYTEKEKVEFKETYRKIQQTAERTPHHLAEFLSYTASNSNMTIIVTDQFHHLLYSSSSMDSEQKAYFTGKMVSDFAESIPIPPGEEYAIQTVLDAEDSEHLIMVAELKPFGKVFLIKSIASIHKSMEIYHEFFFIVMIAIGVVGALIMLFIGSYFMRPIYEILDISKRITNLDFSRKFQTRGDDELNVLGEQINIMSDRLHDNIQQLSESNESLQQDLYRKEKIEKMRKEFLQNASHELKTPISVIASYTEMLKDKLITEEDEIDYYYGVIYDETEKMSNIVKNLLNVAQLESQTMNITLEEFNLTELLNDVLVPFRLKMEKEGILFTENISKNVIVCADRFFMERVITNYLNNAIVHLGEPKEIRVTLYQAGESAYLGVYNATPKVLDSEKIWTSFHKSDESQGNGLGLSIVKAIMEAHKKEYGFSYKDDGVEFFIKL